LPYRRGEEGLEASVMQLAREVFLKRKSHFATRQTQVREALWIAS